MNKDYITIPQTYMDTTLGDYSVTLSNTTVGTSWGLTNMDYSTNGQEYSFAEPGKTKHSIGVDKGSPTKARYAVFYAVESDPVIFCKTRREMYKEVKKLLKRKEVDQKSIRIFSLVGGYRKVMKK